MTLDEALVADDGRPAELLGLDAALTKLAATAPQRARLVELRFFGGLTIEETAEVLEVSPATVKRWMDARTRVAPTGDGERAAPWILSAGIA